MLIFKFISIPLMWLCTILLCSLRPYYQVEFNLWGINDYTLFTASLYLFTTFTINVILRRQLIYDVLHNNARTISFCTGILFIIIDELARSLSGYPLYSIANLLLFTATSYLGTILFKRIYIGQ